MAQSTWLTREEIERDILLFAEYSVPTPEELESDKCQAIDTIMRFKRQMQSNKEKPQDDNVKIETKGSKRVIYPGEDFTPEPQDDIELQCRIREVSGVGYSNQLAEQYIKSRMASDSNKNDDGGKSTNSEGKKSNDF